MNMANARQAMGSTESGTSEFANGQRATASADQVDESGEEDRHHRAAERYPKQVREGLDGANECLGGDR